VLRKMMFVSVFALMGCASQIMQGYVGKSVNEPIFDYGPPSNIIELEDGSRAYQWQIDSSSAFIMPTTSTATAYGPGGPTTIVGQSSTVIPYSNACTYTMFAAQNQGQWIVTGFREPRLGCE